MLTFLRVPNRPKEERRVYLKVKAPSGGVYLTVPPWLQSTAAWTRCSTRGKPRSRRASRTKHSRYWCEFCLQPLFRHYRRWRDAERTVCLTQLKFSKQLHPLNLQTGRHEWTKLGPRVRVLLTNDCWGVKHDKSFMLRSDVYFASSCKKKTKTRLTERHPILTKEICNCDKRSEHSAPHSTRGEIHASLCHQT